MNRPEVTTVREVREAWPGIEADWAATVERARRLPEPLLHERVDGEWSFCETLRHLLFATDCWVRRTILTAPDHHPFGVPPDDDPVVASWGVDLDADPPLDEVLAARADYRAIVRSVIDGLEEGDLQRFCPPNPVTGRHPDRTEVIPLSTCFGVLLNEEREHRRYAERDLAVLESRTR